MGTIECPVCTLYLRADMSLEDHLETHPKEKVIQALVSMAMKPKAAAPQAPAPQQQQLEVVRSRTPPNALMYHHTGSNSSNSSSGGGYEQIQQQHQHQQPMMAAGPAAIAVVKASDMGGYPINNVMIVKSCSTKYVQQIPNSGVSANGGAYTSGPMDGRIFIEPDRGGGGAPTMRRQLGGGSAPGPSLYPPRYTNERYSGPPPPYSTAISSTISSGSQSSIGYGSKYQQEQKPPPPPPAFYPNPPPPIVQTTPTIAQHYYAPPPPPPPMATMQQQPSTSFKGGHVPPRSTLQAQYTEKDDGNFVVTENPKKVVEYTENDEGDFMVIEKIIKSPPRIIQIVDEVEPARPTSKGKVCEEEQEQVEQREDSDYEMEIEEQYQAEDVQKGKVEEEVEQQQQLGTIQIVENEDGTFDDNQQYGLKEMPKPMLIGGIGGTPKKCHKFNFIVEPTASSSAGSSATGSPYTPRKKPTSGLKVLSNVKVTTDLSQGIKDIILNLNCKNKGVNVAGSSSSGTQEAAGTSSGVKTSLITGVVNNNCQNELIINNMPPIDLNDVNDIEIINDDEEDLQPGEDEECYIGSMEVKAAEAPTPSVITSVIRMTPHPSPVVAPPSPPPLPPKLEAVDPEPVDPPKPSTSEVPITKPTPRKPAPLHHQTPSTSAGSLFHKPPKKLTVKLKTPLPPAPPPTPPLIPTASLKQEVHPVDLEQPSTSAEDCKPHAFFVPVVESAAPETKFRPDEPLISSPTTLTLTECSSTEVSRNGPLETIAVTTTTTTKIEQQDALQISETIVYTQSSSPEAAAAAAAEQQAVGSPGPSGMVETTTTSVEYYNITIIDDEAAAAAAAAAQCQPSTEVQLPEDGVKPEEEEQDQKVAMYEVKMAEYEPEREPDSPSSGSSGSDEPETKSCIKVEKMEVMEGSGSAPVDESEKKILVAKVEPVSAADTSGEYQKDDHKDFLEAGPSRTVTTVDGEGSSSSSSSSSSAVASSSQAVVVSSAGPTFLEYSAEYDDYVPVTSYGMPQEQIPLSWVQKFSPQYTPFDDQNSYMDLDQTDSKTNSNSVGGNSSHATSSGGSGSRIETSMDRAPSAESLNIRTDEKMPAKGEISEQESNGDMELSWNRLYPVHENIPIYPSSYDLSTAQECWNLSNRNSTVTGLNQDHAHQGQHQQQQQQYHHHHHLSSSSSSSHHRQQSHQQQQHGHQHGISFQFTSHDQPRPEDDDGLVDDKSKIHLDYGTTAAAGASGSGTNTNYLGASSSGASDPHHHKLAAKVRTYRCTECPKSFALLKQRRAHMQAEHHEAIVDSKLNVLAAAAAASASAASATVTSGAFFANPGEGSSGTTTATATLLSKKIKMEPQPVLMSYSSLKQELEQKQEVVGGCDMAGPSTSGMGASGLGGGGEVRRKRTYVCGTCKHEFDRFKLFNAHLMTHPAECYTCGRSFKHWPNFALHIKRHLGIKDHQCRLCGKKFVIKQKLIEHMRVHTGKAPIKCPDCDQHFRRFSNLAQHRNRHHLNKVPSKKDFVCHCGEVFQSKAKMEWHKEIHENKPKSCPFCREKFIHKNSLTRHIRLSHTEKYVKLETATEMCTICHQPYIKTSMKRHMETHTDERLAYSCTICNKLFSTNWNLKQHKWTHANPTLKPFQCALCSSGFVREADYVTHMNAHKSIRPYTCNHCGCQFIRKYNWIRHTREHETEKNYSCEICNRKFHRKYYLTEHKRIHTGERPFSCNICGKTSSTKTNHNKHIKIHHARDPLTAEG